MSKSENITLVTTSFNYDRGIDARSVQATRGRYPFVLCITLARELDPKISTDILKLFKRCKPDTVYYCSSVRLTEDACIKLEGEIRALINQPVSVRVLGSIQLSDMSALHPTILANHYAAEIDNIKQIFESREDRSSDRDARGLRMALMAYGSSDAQDLRETMSCQMILDALQLGADTELLIAAKISKDFALPKVLNSSYILHILEASALKGLVVKGLNKWRLTELGEKEATRVPPEAAANLLEGRTVVRECLECLIGKKISDDQYTQVWMALLDGFSELFYSNGIGVVSAVSSFLNQSEDKTTADPNLPRLIHQIGKRVKSIFSSDELGSQVVVAIKDMFTERDGRAFNWIAGVCERFVTMCSLGLEATSAAEIKALIVRSYLVLDTDIVLTLLSESEPDHASVKELIFNWKRIGGRFLLCLPVLEEVAYHAWISEYDFHGTKSLLGNLRGTDLRRYSENTFVRSFQALAKSKGEAVYWPDYIASYRGSTKYDYSNVRKHLALLLGAETLPDSIDLALETQISKQVYDMRKVLKVVQARKVDHGEGISKEELKEKESIDKAKRDGRLLASIASGRENQERLGREDTVVLISSSRKLQFVAHQNRVRFGAPDPVLSLGALSYLISLVPNIRLGPDTLRRALFEFGESARSKDHERLALRVIKGSGLYEMAWATRGSLSQKLNGVLYREAKKRDVATASFKKEFAAGNPATDPASVIAQTLEELSVPTEMQNELAELRRQLRDAQLEIDFLREPPRKNS